MNTSIKYILASVAVLLFSCSEKKVQQIPLIEGLVTNYNGGNLFLYNDANPQFALDTIEVSSEGVFSVPKQSINDVGFYYLQFIDVGKINLFLKPNDYFNLQMDANDLLASCRSNNSKLLNAIWKLEISANKFKAEIEHLSAEMSEMEGQVYNDSIYEDLYNQKESIREKYRQESLQIVSSVKSPVVNFLMLNQKAGNTSLFSLQSDIQLFLDNGEELTNDEQLKSIFEEYDNNIMHAYTSIRSEQRYSKRGVFPELRARTNWDEEITLKQVKGQPTHIIFWSGENMLDDDKIKQIKQMMYRYGSKGLKTVMVAYTNNKVEWLAGIKKYRLPYWHLVDTNSLQSIDLKETGVRSLPCNFVVDSTGTIINRDVWNDELEQSIRSYIKK